MISYEAIPGKKVVISGLETWNTTFVPSVAEKNRKVWPAKMGYV